MASVEDSSKDNGEVLSDFVAAQVEGEEAAKSSLEQRGMSVVTTVASIVTFLLAVAGVASSQQEYQLPDHALSLFISAAVFFAVGIILAIGTNFPARYKAMDATRMKSWLKIHMTDGEALARAEVAKFYCDTLERARKVNGRKARLLVAAMSCEFAGVVFLVIVTTLILAN